MPHPARRGAEAPLFLVLHRDQGVRDFMERALRREGYRVSAAPSLRATLALVAREIPALLLLDPETPGTAGLQPLRTWPRGAPAPPVVVLGPDLEPAQIVEAMRLGTAGVLTALSLHELLAEVRRVLGRPSDLILTLMSAHRTGVAKRDELARALHLSPSTVSGHLRRATGQSLRELQRLHQAREIRRAQQLLAFTDL